MKSSVFNFLFVTGSLICFAVQNGFSANSSSNVNNDTLAVKNKLLIDEEHVTKYGLKKITVIEERILTLKQLAQYCPKSITEHNVISMSLSLIKNFYFGAFLPYDTTCVNTYNEDIIISFCDKFKDVDLDEYDKKYYTEMSQNPDMKRTRRSDFWEEVFSVHREHVNPALFVENENAIREIYSELGIDWDGEMFVEKNFLETYRVEIDGFIAENKDRINQAYLK